MHWQWGLSNDEDDNTNNDEDDDDDDESEGVSKRTSPQSVYHTATGRCSSTIIIEVWLRRNVLIGMEHEA